jgi:hypothetical protein
MPRRSISASIRTMRARPTLPASIMGASMPIEPEVPGDHHRADAPTRKVLPVRVPAGLGTALQLREMWQVRCAWRA